MENKPLEAHGDDPRKRALYEQYLEGLRSLEQHEAKVDDTLSLDRSQHMADVARRNRHSEMIDDIELERITSLRTIRNALDLETSALEDVAGKTLGQLSLAYEPGKTTVEDVLASRALPEAEAARRAGVQVSLTRSNWFLKLLKILGMIGCLFLGTTGMGALILRIPPRAMFHSVLLPVAIGLACILVGGTYLVVTPTARRAGAMKATGPEEQSTRRALVTTMLLVALMCIVVAMVDAKAMMAINSARAMVNPSSVPSFAIALLVGLALSAAYVLGSSCLAFADGYGEEAKTLIEAEQVKHLKEERRVIEVAEACEALNAIGIAESRRKTLTYEISKAEQEYRTSLQVVNQGTPKAPELQDDQKRELRVHRQETEFAGVKHRAFETLQARLSNSPKAKDSQEGAK